MDFLLQGIFPTQGPNPRLFMSSALAGEFFTTSGTWEALTLPYYLKKSREPSLVVWKVLGREGERNKILLALSHQVMLRENSGTEAVPKPDITSKSGKPLGSDVTGTLKGGDGCGTPPWHSSQIPTLLYTALQQSQVQ